MAKDTILSLPAAAVQLPRAIAFQGNQRNEKRKEQIVHRRACQPIVTTIPSTQGKSYPVGRSENGTTFFVGVIGLS